MRVFLENLRELLKTLYKSLNSPQDSIHNDSIDCLIKTQINSKKMQKKKEKYIKKIQKPKKLKIISKKTQKK